jgi:hypothetical protein
MLDELEIKVSDFERHASHTRCFLHTVNLIAKSLLGAFERKKDQKGLELTRCDDSNDESGLARELEELSQGYDDEETDVLSDVENDVLDDDANETVGPKVDNVEGWVDEVDEMTDAEQRQLKRAVRPVQLALMKV